MGNFALKPLKQVELDWFIIVWMALIHVLALAAPFTFSWGAFITFLVLYYMTGCLGITLGFHRLLTHRSLKTPLWLTRFLATCGTLALQGSPLEWVAHHRMHHAASDTENDPHNASLGFWYSHLGWLLYRNPQFDDPAKLRKFARDIDTDPYLRWLSKPLTMVGLQVALGLILLSFGGLGYVIWGVFLRLVVIYHITWFVNSASHMWGYRSYSIQDQATNNWWVGILAFGEGWHNNHHLQPEAVHVQHRWWEFDITWQTIKLLKFLGMASNLKMPEKRMSKDSVQASSFS